MNCKLFYVFLWFLIGFVCLVSWTTPYLHSRWHTKLWPKPSSSRTVITLGPSQQCGKVPRNVLATKGRSDVIQLITDQLIYLHIKVERKVVFKQMALNCSDTQLAFSLEAQSFRPHQSLRTNMNQRCKFQRVGTYDQVWHHNAVIKVADEFNMN